MPTHQGDFEIATSKEAEMLCKEKGMIFGERKSNWEFWSPDVTIHGEHVGRWGHNVDTVTNFHHIPTTSGNIRSVLLKRWKGVSEEIPGLKCPYCQSQAFKTDQPGVAVCGAAPGWFMFYRRLNEEKETKQKTKLIVRGGELVEVPVEETEVTKEIL